ncbi:MAG: hypothetical protein KKC55_14220 [Gammaproteobacteria bacterium]|nr:hypothetical protein [Gammaproteobacteria bacterium]
MSDLAKFLTRSGKVPGVRIYDPEMGPGVDPGAGLTIWLPEIDELEGMENEHFGKVPGGQETRGAAGLGADTV